MEKTIPQELEILSTEQLMEILHIHAQTDSLISDTLALQVLEVLERRETEHPSRNAKPDRSAGKRSADC